MSQPDRKYLTATDAADYVGYTPNTLAQYRCRRIGPSYLKARGRVLYAVEELDRWVESQTMIEVQPAETSFEGCAPTAGLVGFEVHKDKGPDA